MAGRATRRCETCGEHREMATKEECFACYRSRMRARDEELAFVDRHNPAIEDLALMLAAPAAGPDATSAAGLERMRAKFPTAAIAVLQPAGTWRGLVRGRAALTAFVSPRDLPMSSDRQG